MPPYALRISTPGYIISVKQTISSTVKHLSPLADPLISASLSLNFWPPEQPINTNDLLTDLSVSTPISPLADPSISGSLAEELPIENPVIINKPSSMCQIEDIIVESPTEDNLTNPEDIPLPIDKTSDLPRSEDIPLSINETLAPLLPLSHPTTTVDI